MTDIDIAVEDNTNREEAVKHGDEEGIEHTEATERGGGKQPKDICGVEDNGDVTETDETVKTNKLVNQGELGLLLDHPDYRQVDSGYRGGGYQPKHGEEVGRHSVIV